MGRNTLSYLEAAAMIKAAFEEGWSAYTTASNSMTTMEEEWNNSTAKVVYDGYIEKIKNSC